MSTRAAKTDGIRFDQKRDLDFVKELRAEVKDYFAKNSKSKFGNLGMKGKTIFMFLAYFAPYALLFTNLFTSVWIYLGLYMWMGLGMAGIGFSIMHDANHRSYSKNQFMNKLMGLSISLIGGYAPTWRIQHNVLHHGFTNVEGFDEDINPPTAILRFSPHKPRYWIHRFQHLYAWFFYGLMTVTWSIDKDFKQLYRYNKQGLLASQGLSVRKMLLEMIGSKILYYSYLLVLPLIFVPLLWWQILILYFIMHFTCGLLLGLVFQTAHVMPSNDYPEPDKSGMLEHNWVTHQLFTTSDYSPKSKFFSWFIGGLNYQVEHHLFPNICHIHYPKIAKIVKETAHRFGYPYNVQPNFAVALINHGRMLKKLGQEDSPSF